MLKFYAVCVCVNATITKIIVIQIQTDQNRIEQSKLQWIFDKSEKAWVPHNIYRNISQYAYYLPSYVHILVFHVIYIFQVPLSAKCCFYPCCTIEGCSNWSVIGTYLTTHKQTCTDTHILLSYPMSCTYSALWSFTRSVEHKVINPFLSPSHFIEGIKCMIWCN